MNIHTGRMSEGKPGYKEISISPEEIKVGSWAGAALIGGASAIGIQTILTDRQLFLAPLDLSKTVKLFEVLSKYIGEIKTPIDIFKDILEVSGTQKVVSIPLDEIQSVESLGNASLLLPPAIRLLLKDGNVLTFGVLKSKLTPNLNPENNAYRDELLTRLRLEFRFEVNMEQI